MMAMRVMAETVMRTVVGRITGGGGETAGDWFGTFGAC